MTISIRPCPPVLSVICEGSSEKDALPSPETLRLSECRKPSEIQSPSEPPKFSYRPHAPVQPDSSSPPQMLSGDSVMPQGHFNSNVLIGANNGDLKLNNSPSEKGYRDFKGKATGHDNPIVIVNLNVITNHGNIGNHGNLEDSKCPINRGNLPAPTYSTFSMATSTFLREAGNANQCPERPLVTENRGPDFDHDDSSDYLLGCNHNPINM